MAPEPIDDLLTVEARLDRSFTAAIVTYLAMIAWTIYAAILESRAAWIGYVTLAFALGVIATYIWFAVAASAAAARVDRSRVLVLAWILLAPFVGLIIGVMGRIVGLLIAASPLSLKFILSSELRELIHRRTFAD
jgi:hypothetical protein